MLLSFFYSWYFIKVVIKEKYFLYIYTRLFLFCAKLGKRGDTKKLWCFQFLGNIA